jgi:hypothetical protein
MTDCFKRDAHVVRLYQISEYYPKQRCLPWSDVSFNLTNKETLFQSRVELASLGEAFNVVLVLSCLKVPALAISWIHLQVTAPKQQQPNSIAPPISVIHCSFALFSVQTTICSHESRVVSSVHSNVIRQEPLSTSSTWLPNAILTILLYRVPPLQDGL